MGKKRWTTKDQFDWLEALLPGFIQAQRDKTTTQFFEKMYGDWHDKWPVKEPTEDEIETAGGSTEARASNLKAVETVRVQ